MAGIIAQEREKPRRAGLFKVTLSLRDAFERL
jgi:hypothetical protein